MPEEERAFRPRVAHCVFCDDVRMELGNKPSLMGCYSADLSVDQPFPVILPKLAVCVWLIADISDRPSEMTFCLILPDKHELFRIPVPVAMISDVPDFIKDGAEKMVFNFQVPCAPFPLPCEGMIEVWIETEREKLRAGRLWVHRAVPN